MLNLYIFTKYSKHPYTVKYFRNESCSLNGNNWLKQCVRLVSQLLSHFLDRFSHSLTKENLELTSPTNFCCLIGNRLSVDWQTVWMCARRGSDFTMTWLTTIVYPWNVTFLLLKLILFNNSNWFREHFTFGFSLRNFYLCFCQLISGCRLFFRR